ncbi:MAG: YgjV family protein [Butyricicoccus sp.]|nr:YgjV family protein [Butyricicoccus sp.]
MNNIIILANAIALASSILVVATGLICDRRRVLLAQCVQKLLGGTSNLLLGGMSGCISNFIGIARNLWCLKKDMSLAMKTALSLAQIALTSLLSRVGPLESLPMAATVIFTFAADTKNPVAFKGVMLLTQAMWTVYDLAIGNYVAFTFDVFAVCSILISIAVLKGLVKTHHHRTRAV